MRAEQLRCIQVLITVAFAGVAHHGRAISGLPPCTGQITCCRTGQVMCSQHGLRGRFDITPIVTYVNKWCHSL